MIENEGQTWDTVVAQCGRMNSCCGFLDDTLECDEVVGDSARMEWESDYPSIAEKLS